MEIRMGDRKMEGCYEIAEILIGSPSIVEKWLDDAEALPHTLMHTVVGWYLWHPQPSVEDIKSCSLSKRGPWTVLTLTIRRGKEMLTEFFSRHKVIEFVATDECCAASCLLCNQRVIIPWDSVGDTGGPLVKQAIAACNAATSPDPRSIQRTVDSDSYNSEQKSRVGSVDTHS